VKNSGEVIFEHRGKQYGATYTVSEGMLLVKTHTETRSVEIGNRDAEALARQTLEEIVNSQPRN
jgi:hypothetical protein